MVERREAWDNSSAVVATRMSKAVSPRSFRPLWCPSTTSTSRLAKSVGMKMEMGMVSMETAPIRFPMATNPASASVQLIGAPSVQDASHIAQALYALGNRSALVVHGSDGLDDLRTIIGDAPGRLRPNGWIVVEHGHDQGEAVRALMETAGLVDVETRQDLAGSDRMSAGRMPSHRPGRGAGP